MRPSPPFAALALCVTLLAGLSGCGRSSHSPRYLEACHGEPLSLEEREQAMQEGYEIRPGYNCIDKASWVAVQEQKAAWEAANTPAAKARREAERVAAQAQAAEEHARRAALQADEPVMPPEPVVLRKVDANTASEAELAAVITLDAEVAAQIVAARRERPFRDWADLVDRVVGLSAAQPAAFASICGLTVAGESLLGAEPDAQFAARLRERYRRD
jgi:DNA uptake protein ComE-like DNA-binding protein